MHALICVSQGRRFDNPSLIPKGSESTIHRVCLQFLAKLHQLCLPTEESKGKMCSQENLSTLEDMVLLLFVGIETS